jgi:copper homeostasis protein
MSSGVRRARNRYDKVLMPRSLQTRPRRPLVEVCVESTDDAVAAARGGAGRIELNAALALDGLTPSPGVLIETRRAVRVPLIAMARPRGGDFVYSATEFRALRRDVDFALEHGADGVAFGILTGNREIDTRRCRQVARQLDGRPATLVFHRAFDAVADPFKALDQLIDLGVHRIMTSGGCPTATAGASVLARLRERAAGRIEILPAGGVRPANAARLLARTGCDQLHTSARGPDGRMDARILAGLVRVARAGR